jgi:protein tyrosine phosphatase (PTP) superfamily phosphohydrolase (DUF442 family)
MQPARPSIRLLALLLLGSMFGQVAAAAEPPTSPFTPVAESTWLGGALTASPAAAAETLRASGIATVIDLRQPDEPGVADEAEAFAAAGLRHVNFPMDGAPLDASRRAELARLLQETAGERRLLHCVSGNRAALAWAIHRIDEGASVEAALAEVDGVLTRPALVHLVEAHAAARDTVARCAHAEC